MKPLALAVLLAAVAGLALAAEPEKAPPDPRDRGPDKIDISSYPPEQQKRYPIFEKKCAKCHPVARSIGSGPKALAGEVRNARNVAESNGARVVPRSRREASRLVGGVLETIRADPRWSNLPKTRRRHRRMRAFGTHPMFPLGLQN